MLAQQQTGKAACRYKNGRMLFLLLLLPLVRKVKTKKLWWRGAG
jgi:hypothetical protein